MKNLNLYHRFLDEAGDTTFYGKGRVNIIGMQGVSKCFILGMVKFKEPLNSVRNKIIDLQKEITVDDYYKEVPSIQKKFAKDGYYFHATDDVPEVREKFFKFIRSVECSFEAVVGRKIPDIYEKKHNGRETEFYADLLSHLLKNKLTKDGKLVLKIAERGKSTKNRNLMLALEKAKNRFDLKKPGSTPNTNIVFDVQNQISEPLLNISDYFCWSVQRVFERGDTRYYNFIIDQISLVVDLYDQSKYEGSKNYYRKNNKLTKMNAL